MVWKKWGTWFKGAIVGLIISLIISIGIVSNKLILNKLAMPGLETCRLLTQCPNCIGCNVVGLMFNLFYGFIIGALVGYIITKMKKGNNKDKLRIREKKRKR